MRHSAETKEKLSEMRRGERNPFFGRRHSPEFIAAAKMRAMGKGTPKGFVRIAEQKITVPTGNDLAYLAGMIDADGSVRFKRGRPFVTVYNTCMPLMDWLMRTMTHGCIAYGNMGREQVMSWTIGSAKDVYALLMALRPLLIVKKNDAGSALAHLRSKYEWAK